MSPQNTSTSSWAGGQPWAGGWGYQPRRKGTHGNPSLRVSDAERADVADRLSKHYGDGRLDQAEFNDRMERAMNAKTQGDFAGLFDDLPDVAGQEPAQLPVNCQPARRSSPMSRIVLLVLLVVAAVILGHVLAQWFFPWLLLGIVAYLLLRHHERSHHRA